ncbi:MAG: CdvA-like protein [Nitrososphaerota archaeon]
MSSDEIEIVGKPVKDMYGTAMGKVVGTITAIDGSIDTVGIDCGSDVLKQVPFEQLVVKEDVVIFIPKWRLDSHRLLRAKELALRRLKALMNLSTENEEMKEDAGLIHEKYKSQLQSLNETEAKIKQTLDKRKAELDEHLKSVKMFLFDAKVQFNSDEIAQSKFDSIKSQTAEIMERISHEKAEILNIQQRIADLSLDDIPTETPKQQIEESAQSYLESTNEETVAPVQTESTLPEVPRDVETKNAVHNYACIIAQQNKKPDDTEPGDWLTRMQAQ